MRTASNVKKGYLYILLTTIIFSAAEPIFKMVGGYFNPVQFVATRFFFGGLVLLPFALKYLKDNDIGYGAGHKVELTKRDIVDLIISGVLNVTISMTFYQMALALIPASTAAVLLCTNPVTTAMIARFVLGEPINRNRIIMVVLTIIGVLVIIDPLNVSLDLTGLLFMGITVITFSLYSVIGKRATNKVGGLTANSITSIVGGLVTFIFIFATNIPALGEFFIGLNMPNLAYVDLFAGYSLGIMPGVVWVWVVQTGLGFLAYFKGMELTSATEGSIVFLLKITLGPIISMIVLGEVISFNLALGMIITTIGSLFVIVPGLKQVYSERNLTTTEERA